MLFEINKLNLIGMAINIDLILFGNETLTLIKIVAYFWLYKNTLKTPVAFLCHEHKCF